MTESEMIAEFIARKGVTRVEAGVRLVDEKAWRYRGDSFDGLSREQRAINERHVVIGSNGVEHVRNGLGEWLS